MRLAALTSRLVLGLACLAAPLLASAQRAALVQSVDEPGRSPYQQIVIFNQGTSTCTGFVCSVSFPAVPAGKRLVVTYASGFYSVPGGGASVAVRSSGNFIGAQLPLPQSYGATTYVAAGPLMFFVDAGNQPVIDLAGYNVNQASFSAQAAIIGYLVSVP